MPHPSPAPAPRDPGRLTVPCPRCNGVGFGAYLADSSGLDDWCPDCEGGRVPAPTDYAALARAIASGREVRATWDHATVAAICRELLAEVEVRVEAIEALVRGEG